VVRNFSQFERATLAIKAELAKKTNAYSVGRRRGYRVLPPDLSGGYAQETPTEFIV
jgi:hypothetical protein